MNQMPDIPNFLDRRPGKRFVATYSNLHMYDDVCPHKMYRTYIKKDLPFVESDEMKWGNAVHAAMEHRVGAFKPLPDNMRAYEKFAMVCDGKNALVELKVAVDTEGHASPYFDNATRLRGKVDVYIPTGETAAFMVDWKTGGSKYELPFELELHALMLRAKFPALKTIKGAFCWLKEDRMGQMYDLSDFNSTWAKVNNIIEQIEDDIEAGHFAKRQGPLCGWCSVFDCEHNPNRS